MMSKMLRCNHMGDVVAYLFGPGRHEEHSNQRVVAGSDPSWVGVTQPDREALAQLIAELNDPMVRFGDRTKLGYVAHVVVSVKDVDGVLSDEQWQTTAEAMADAMGFDDKVEWVAVNHGLSENGNDHIHLVANLIRTDGRVAKMPYERLRRREVCLDLEQRWGLTVTAQAGMGQGSLARREVEAVASGQVADVADLTRRRVATVLRGVVAGVRTEQEFVERLRGEGLLVRPRMDKDNPGQVVGYSVGQRGLDTGGRLVWYGGGTLGKDLRLPALRARWGQTPQQRLEAAPVWANGKSKQQTVTAAHSAEVAKVMGAVSRMLERVPAGDAATWNRIALDSAGLLAAAASSSSDPATRRALIGAWREVHRAVPVTSYATVPGASASGGERVPGPETQGLPSEPGALSAPARRTAVWLGSAARVLMAGKFTDAAPELRLQALVAQAAQLVAQISRTIAAQAAASDAQRRAADAVQRAAEQALRTADVADRVAEQVAAGTGRGPDEGLRSPDMWGFDKSAEQMLADAADKRAAAAGRGSAPAAQPAATPERESESGPER